MTAKHAVLCAVVLLGACAIGKPMPQATTYVIDPPAATELSVATRRPQTLRMGNVRIAAAFAGNALVYRLNDVQYVSDPYNGFIAEPGAMLGNRIAEWLDRAGPFATVTQPDSPRPAAFLLEATVTELYGDFRPGHHPAAVLTVQFALIDQTGTRAKVEHESTIVRRVEVAQASPDALVRGYGTALAEILAQLAPELGSQNGSARASIEPPR
jgi:cholesterol transport system auxiliary component